MKNISSTQSINNDSVQYVNSLEVINNYTSQRIKEGTKRLLCNRVEIKA